MYGYIYEYEYIYIYIAVASPGLFPQGIIQRFLYWRKSISPFLPHTPEFKEEQSWGYSYSYILNTDNLKTVVVSE